MSANAENFFTSCFPFYRLISLSIYFVGMHVRMHVGATQRQRSQSKGFVADIEKAGIEKAGIEKAGIEKAGIEKAGIEQRAGNATSHCMHIEAAAIVAIVTTLWLQTVVAVDGEKMQPPYPTVAVTPTDSVLLISQSASIEAGLVVRTP
ncbi:hypothetical protein QBC46DRAFT_407847 [Diplogelasinospora grovesii]|uniref:Uncharacterized protein n=1 Tax=Diplogelasinospora grovesii TaxID=303347 RepID=A0AAN6S5I1_9PEZI|nr:hypothetical protein QBC46DRAFT_407847 [Diplogelasinospora grovesii]